MRKARSIIIRCLMLIAGILFTYPCFGDVEIIFANDTAKQSPRRKLSPALDYTYLEYIGRGYYYNSECSPEGWSLVVKWSDIENDIYKKIDCTREEFLTNYGEPVESVQGDLQQYVLVSGGRFYESQDPIGTINSNHETSSEEGSFGISSLQWNITSTQAQVLFLADPYVQEARAIKFESKDKSKWQDVYILFTTGKDVTITTPKGSVKLDDSSLINSFWYTHNQGDEGFDEIHANTLSPKDNTGGNAEELSVTFSDVFERNLSDLTPIISVTGDNTAYKEFEAGKLSATFVFDKSNEGKKYMGVDGKTYTMTVSSDGLTLSAYLKTKTDAQPIAMLVGDDPRTTTIEYQKTDYAKALLNYVAAQNLNDNAITATIAIKAYNQCPKEIELENNTFDVRFLRPLNASNANVEYQNPKSGMSIDLKDLITFSDWQDSWKDENKAGGEYFDYYGIKSITIDGVSDGQVISNNVGVLTNLGQNASTFVPMASVTSQIDFIYNNGTITYRDYLNINSEFSVIIPLTIEYIWGKIPVRAQLKLSPTMQTGLSVNSTNFPDANFRNWILQNVNGAEDAVLTDAEIANIKKITCTNKSISSLQCIEYFTALDTLSCANNQLTSIDVSKNTTLKYLNCSGNQLTRLSISGNAALERLDCSDNKITSLDVRTNDKLTYLECGGNQLSSLRLGTKESLKTLYCSSNLLEVLTVTGCPALTDLRCFGNGLLELDVSQCTYLERLDCYGNGITVLDLNKNTVLRRLDCANNDLTTLNISGCSTLSTLYCNGNKLSYLDLSKNTALSIFRCDYNQLTSIDLSKGSSSVYATISPQQPELTAIVTREGIAIPVSSDFDLSKVSDLKLAGVSVTGTVTNINNQKYLMFADRGTPESNIEGKQLTYSYDANDSQHTLMSVTVSLHYDASTLFEYTLSIQSGSGGSVTYNGKTVTNTTTVFTVDDGSSVTIMINPNNGYRLASLVVNGTNVTSNVINNQYTISDISTNTTVVATFEVIPPITYSLSIQSGSGGSVSYNGTTISNTTRSFTVNEGTTATITISPNSGYRLSTLTVNGSNVTSSVTNNQYTISSIAANTTVVATFEVIPPTTYTLSIQSGGGGSVTYNGTTITNTTRSFTVNEGTTATITISPNSGYKLVSLTVNSTNVTSGVSNNQYTINNISANTTVVVSFAENLQSFSAEGINYQMVSAANKTLNVSTANYSGHVIIPISVSYEGETWSVRDAASGVFNNAAITAITWNPKYALSSNAFGNQTNPNLLLYVQSASYAPSNVQNVIANGNAKKIVLTDAASGNDFDCPESFTAEEISYTHKYTMTSGISECRGWETIALPFRVKSIMHESKGQLIPFRAYSGNGKPFWLYEWSASGFVESSSIEANTPYIISFPNNEYYYPDYNISGVITFSSNNVTVQKSSDVKIVSGKNKKFVPNYSTLGTSTQIYPLNVQNEFSSNNDYHVEGSTFIQELRTVHPFEAYMTTSSGNAKRAIPIFEDLPTAIREIPLTGFDSEKGLRIYTTTGNLVLFSETLTLQEALKRLPRGVYIINGKKLVVK